MDRERERRVYRAFHRFTLENPNAFDSFSVHALYGEPAKLEPPYDSEYPALAEVFIFRRERKLINKDDAFDYYHDKITCDGMVILDGEHQVRRHKNV